VIVADTSGLLAYFNRQEPQHGAVSTVIDQSTVGIVVSPFVIAELDYLVFSRLGVEAELTVGRALTSGAYVLPQFDAEALEIAYGVVDRYRDQAIGLTDASLVVLADRFSTTKVLTLDRRHFEVLCTLDGRTFDVIP
jgi:hypothetical protein